ncbi:MAG: ATP-binding cassette domain-containing protein [Proteobacteria bacterium]|nr:ATP-binding cassette domain-containing protein [Pseudomonadota bacterium]
MPSKKEIIVQAKNLTKFYGDKEVVKGVDFAVEEGECFGFLGPNGAGKTTTMGMIYCFTPPSKGELKVCSIDVGHNDKRIKELIGVAPQEDTLDPDLTVIENFLVYGRYFNIPKKNALARALELLDFMQLKDRCDNTVSELSGGMRRRLVIARALINSPKLIVLDEPTTGLDPQARHHIWDRLKKLKKEGATLLLTTHYMEEAHQLCDRLVIMDNGKFVAHGKPDDLIKEKLEKEVIEILSREGLTFDIDELLEGLTYRYEKSGEREYLFAEDGDPLVKRLMDLGQLELLHRKATLEDLFLQLTGRALEE